jgi:hypothetical protein
MAPLSRDSEVARSDPLKIASIYRKDARQPKVMQVIIYPHEQLSSLR